ncbi:DNA alkylation repair protein [Paenibacillus sp. 1P03SA]|uniref:DNA alkylation repair protein n=1 Tax=Paenibacillus sp. 1P03SA TaxID=3132294 RepID=UPI0039A1911E
MELLKDLYSPTFFERFIHYVNEKYPAFDGERFRSSIYDDNWDQEAFKQRMRHITRSLTETLPSSYPEALEVLAAVAPQCRGVEYLFFPDFIELNGLGSYELSMQFLQLFTPYSSSEYAVRPFLLQELGRTLEHMKQWARHENEHIRRLASEGCRPRLPWASNLPALRKDPRPILPILETLKEDPSEYVRKSVANNLNDISKDHPELVLELAKGWYGKTAATNWIVKHGCRSLLRKGDSRALSLFGYEEIRSVSVHGLDVKTGSIAAGENLEFSFRLVNESEDVQALRVDYEIGYRKKNGTLAPKRFKLTEKPFGPGTRPLVKRHSFKLLTTRTYYAGQHEVRILVNGTPMAAVSFEFTG